MTPEQAEMVVEIKVDVARIGAILERQEASLAEHMRRSDANEKAVALLEKTLVGHMSRMNLVLAILAAVGTAVLAVLFR